VRESSYRNKRFRGRNTKLLLNVHHGARIHELINLLLNSVYVKCGRKSNINKVDNNLLTIFFCKVSPFDNTSYFIRIISYTVPIVTEIFLPCLYGSAVTEASIRLSTSIYNCQWVDEDREFKKILMIYKKNAKQSIHITALGVAKVNLESFTKICNSAYSLYAVLKRMNE
jgi:hypothetical protein